MPPVPKAVRLRTATGWQDIALVGPEGPTGPSGAVEVYEQDSEPLGAALGALWIDTDEDPPLYALLPFDPVATVLDLPVPGSFDGEVRLVLDTPRMLYSWVEEMGAWVSITAGGTGGTPVTGDWIDIPFSSAGLGVGKTLVWDTTDARFEPEIL